MVIVGGGTAGWISALALSRCFPSATIVVVESPVVPTIGVGESTLPTVGRTLASLGFDERVWMTEVGATYKLGVRFVDWCQPGSRVSRSDFWNPVEQITDRAAVEQWFRHARSSDFAAACCTTPPLLERNLIPLTPGGERLSEYAFHVDAVGLAAMLQARAIETGVIHVRGHVADVGVGSEGIDDLTLDSNRTVRASLYVDCTGFSSLLLERLGEPWLSYDDHLLTDSAVAIGVPSAVQNGDAGIGASPVATYTEARALQAGWMWKVPLVDRVGAGYVYSSSHLDADRAEAELRAQLGPAADNAPARHLAARTGRRRRSWVGNCVAIGLSSGFVEPLEATGIYFIERAVASMVDGLRSGDRDRFNEMMTASYEEVRDLIVMHYLVNDRQDTTFWRATKEITVPSSLAARLETWRHRPPAAADFPRPAVFGVTTWMSVLAGMGFWREPFDDTASVIVSDEVERARRRLLDESTDHRRLLAAGA